MLTQSLTQIIYFLVERAYSPDEWQQLDDLELIAPDSEAERLLHRWETRMQTGTGKSTAFNERLNQLGLTRSQALQRLTSKTLPASASLPSWAEFLTEVFCADTFWQPILSLEQLQDYSLAEREYWKIDADSTPLFPEFLHPFISVALKPIISCILANSSLIHAGIIIQIGRYLLYRLSKLAVRTIAYEVKQRSLHGELTGETSSDCYQSFIGDTLGTIFGQLEFFQIYPVLARLLATVCQQVTEAMLELLDRFAQDYTELNTYFAADSLGRLISLLPGLSDPHQGGRTVCRLEFTNGLTLAYKPRSLAVDAAFNHLLDWWNQQPQTLPLRSTRLLLRPNYGWSEWIVPQSCTSTAAVARFYQRHGIYLALLYFLGGKDFHQENVIPAGEYPMLIDLEGILSPGFIDNSLQEVPPAYRPLINSVLDIGLLPFWTFGETNRELHISSGINGHGDRAIPVKLPTWRGLGTDQLRLNWEYRQQSYHANQPRLDDRSIPVNGYINCIVAGFKTAYTVISHHHQHFLAHFQSLTTRRLFRPTQTYYDLLFWSSAPDQLTSGAAYDVALERLAWEPSLSEFAQLDDEKRCLWQQDIPVYYGNVSELNLRSGSGKTYTAVFAQTSYHQLQQRLQHASPTDLAWQSQLIHASFNLSLQPKQPLPNSSSWLDRAVTIGNALEQTALRDTQQGTTWLTLHKIAPKLTGIYYAVSDPWLYAGTAGIGLFLANLAAHTEDDRYSTLAREAFRYSVLAANWLLMHNPSSAMPTAGRAIATGFGGISSLVYALTEAGRCLQDATLWHQAHRLALAPLPSPSDSPDVLNGAAGTVLTLLHLYQFQPDPQLLQQALTLGQALVERQDPQSGGWAIGHRPLLGMGHGAAGIIYALAQLQKVAPQPQFLAAIRAGLHYERQQFSPQYQDWPNLQNTTQLQFMTGWCAGATGIGLARLGMLEVLNDDTITAEIETAIAATSRQIGRDSHHLCCGEAGRIFFLLTAARELERSSLLATAQRAGQSLIQSHAQSGYWKLQEFCERNTVPSLMGGIAGLGLTFLALANPNRTSNVLLLR